MKGFNGYTEGNLGADIEERTFTYEGKSFTKLNARVAIWQGKDLESIWVSASLPNWDSLREGKKGQKIRMSGKLVVKKQPDGTAFYDFEAHDADLTWGKGDGDGGADKGIGTSPRRGGKAPF